MYSSVYQYISERNCGRNCYCDKREMPIKRINTIRMDFKGVKKKPTLLEIHRWIMETFKFTEEQIMAIQFQQITSKLYIKLVSNVLMTQVLNKFGENVEYVDRDGLMYQINIGEEVEEIKVRIFDFPIELDNGKIKEKLEQYGVVKSIRNEMYNGKGLYKVENGIRTINMVMKKKCTVIYYDRRTHIPGNVSKSN